MAAPAPLAPPGMPGPPLARGAGAAPLARAAGTAPLTRGDGGKPLARGVGTAPLARGDGDTPLPAAAEPPDRTIGPSVRNTAVSAADGTSGTAETTGASETGEAEAGSTSGPPGTPSADTSVIRGMYAVCASASGARCRPRFAPASRASDGSITRQPARSGGHSTRRTPALTRSSRRFPGSRVRSRRPHRGIAGHPLRSPTLGAWLWVRLSP
jgi:hypothetical protein